MTILPAPTLFTDSASGRLQALAEEEKLEYSVAYRRHSINRTDPWKKPSPSDAPRRTGPGESRWPGGNRRDEAGCRRAAAFAKLPAAPFPGKA
jgi:hypothetical protein